MSEPEKKGSPWPWVLVPVCAFTLFFVLRECRQSLPPALHISNTAPSPAVNPPAIPETPAPANAEAAAAAPAPQ